MITAKAIHNKSFIDSVVDATGTIDVLFESALESAQSITDPQVPGSTLVIVEPSIKRNELLPQLPKLKPIQKVAAFRAQNIQDLTIQTSGSLEHIFEMALLNGISITEETVPGQKYKAEFEAPEKEIVNYYRVKGLRPATAIKKDYDTTYAVWEYVVNNYWI